MSKVKRKRSLGSRPLPMNRKARDKNLLFFPRSCLFSPGTIGIFEASEELSCTHPDPHPGALSLEVLARVGQVEHACLKTSP